MTKPQAQSVPPNFVPLQVSSGGCLIVGKLESKRSPDQFDQAYNAIDLTNVMSCYHPPQSLILSSSGNKTSPDQFDQAYNAVDSTNIIPYYPFHLTPLRCPFQLMLEFMVVQRKKTSPDY